MNEIKPICPICTISQSSRDKYKAKTEALQALIYHIKESLSDSITIQSDVDALSMFNFIEKRLTEMEGQ